MQPSTTNPLAPRFAGTTFRWPFRRYQQLALDGYERGRQTDARRAYIVMPPGSGKTAVGLEIARRRGQHTLVLCPNTAVQAQWLRQWRDFQPETVPATSETDLSAPLIVLTYQAICNVNTDSDELDERALDLWRAALQANDDLPPHEAERRIQELAGAANEHFDAEMARYRRRVRRLIAEGGERDELLGLLHPNGREIIARMRQTSPWTVVLDECHHLLNMWGSLVRAIVDELGADTFVLGLTATPPVEMNASEARLYHDIFGRADFQVPTPAVVKEGDLAPYQELVYLTQPLSHEEEYIASQHLRFEELLVRLMDADFASRPFTEWLRVRAEERQSNRGVQLSWARFERDEPELAQAMLRFLYQKRLPTPEGARIGERHRIAPSADDWVALIEDFCLGHLRASSDPRDAAAWETIRQALPSLGYVLTRQGVRAYVSPVDRVLSLSASKATAALTILELEEAELGGNLRALLLCDYERAGSDVIARLRGVLDPQAGSAALLLHLLISDADVAALDPILMTGRTVACSEATKASLIPWLEAQVPEMRGSLQTERLFQTGAENGHSAWDNIVRIRGSSSWWRPRHYVPLLTRYFEEGHSRCLVGTRSLLGEGWDAKRVNVLIDLTAAGTSTAVHQMRGRSLRLDPLLPRKVANNWDIVCVDPDHPKGAADYNRFVRKHRHYYAPTSAGEIESGVSHVHPELSPFGPPQSAQFPEINTAMLRRAGDRERAYDLWAIGEPYLNAETHTVRVRLSRSAGLPSRRVLRHAEAGDDSGVRRRLLATGGGALAAGLTGAMLGPDLIGLGAGAATLAGGGWWTARWLDDALDRLKPSDALEDFAAAVADGLRAAGAISVGAEAVRVVVQPDGYYRCYLAGSSEEESRIFAEALDDLLSPLSAPRYLIPRYVHQQPRSRWETARLALRLARSERTGRSVVYHAVPTWLAANRERADLFARAWNVHVSAGEPLYWKDPLAQAILETQAGEDPFDVMTQMRVLWH